MDKILCKCKMCGGNVYEDEKTGKAICESCGNVYDNSSVDQSLSNMMKSGYEFEKGRIQAQKEEASKNQSQNQIIPPLPIKEESIAEKKQQLQKRENLKIFAYLSFLYAFLCFVSIRGPYVILGVFLLFAALSQLFAQKSLMLNTITVTWYMIAIFFHIILMIMGNLYMVIGVILILALLFFVKENIRWRKSIAP